MKQGSSIMHVSYSLALGLGLAVAAATPAGAVTLLALTDDNRLVEIDSETLAAGRPVAIRGAQGRLLGIDQRAADGKIYGVTDTGQIVTIDHRTGQAVVVARLSEPFTPGGRSVVDFNPMADRLRLMGMNGVNFRVHPDTGAVTRDGGLKYQPGPLGGTVPRIVAGAYTNSIGKPSSTALYTIDTLLGQLNLQAPPNDGVQQARGAMASLPAGVAFDILADAQGGNRAWLLSAGQLGAVALETGEVRSLGVVAGLPGSEIVDIAALR